MQKYKRSRKYPGMRSIPLRSPRRVNWTQYGGSSTQPEVLKEEKVIDGVLHIIIPDTQSPTKLEGKRPSPSAGVTDDCFGIEITRYKYDEHRVAHKLRGEPPMKNNKILLETTNIYVKVFLFWNLKECYLIEENTHFKSNKRFFSQSFQDNKEAKNFFLSRRTSIRWLRSEPL